ncbi:hypothetical protein HPB47_026344, partial [Ixodes persulcatus]
MSFHHAVHVDDQHRRHVCRIRIEGAGPRSARPACNARRYVTRGDYGRCPVNLRRKEKAASEAPLRSRMHDRLQDPVLFSHWDRNIPKGDTHLQENSGVCALHFDE